MIATLVGVRRLNGRAVKLGRCKACRARLDLTKDRVVEPSGLVTTTLGPDQVVTMLEDVRICR